jgi:hypothetical protein
MRKRRGFSLMIEAVFVSLLVVLSFAISYYFLTPSNPRLFRSQADMSQYAYNVLTVISSSGGFDYSIVFMKGGVPVLASNWEQQVKDTLVSSLPPSMIFNLTVYDSPPATSKIGIPSPLRLANCNPCTPKPLVVPITNAAPLAFLRAAQVTSITFIYTTPQLVVLDFNLQVATLTTP